ncbi:GTP cyclohydrolase II [Entomortierella parvispora]|uniref:GTP cyclohydrolase II n=1 Tax=Entomortierella parvispora TaxID=205924 RepID=A0A9P3H7G0_9FUNG|nr:GTP cyclohydrolase II [Entomortierella parvispora]
MACDISMNEAPAVAPSAGYIPRNAIDHMSPFFFKSHSHSHGHAHHHSHSHRHHHTNHNSSQDAHSVNPTTSLQNPTPRRLSAVDSSLSAPTYNTPPATPPLKVTSQTIAAASSPAVLSPTKKHTGKPVEKDSVAWCTARARIPTPDGSEYFLHIYENTMDKKEHLAFVFGDQIRSKSLDRVQPNETETDRVKRGAYTGRLVSSVQNENQTSMTDTTIATPVAINSEDSVMEDTPKAAGTAASAPLVRIHSECFTGEIGHSARCDCGEQLDEAIRLMKAEGAGVVVYLRQEGRGIGLGEKLKAYNLQDLGYDTVMANLLLNHGADERTYEVAQAILEDLGQNQIRLLTNNPDKIEQVEKNSEIKVVERVPMMPKSWEALEQGRLDEFEVKEGAVENKIVKGKELDRYLKVKVERMRHLISVPTSL